MECPMFNELEVIFLENSRLDPQTANYSNAEGVDTEYGLSDASRSASPDKTTNCKDHPSVDVGCSQKRSPTPDSHIQEKKKARMTSTELAEIRVPSMESGKKWTEPTEMRVLPGNPESAAGFPIRKCVKCLESIEGVDSNTYLQAIKMFKDADWREIFMAMSAQRRLDWLASLN